MKQLPMVNKFNYHQIFFWLCLTSACDKFCFHGIRFMLVLHMVKNLLISEHKSYAAYGTVMALTSACPLIGGWIADRLIGSIGICLIGSSLSLSGCLILILNKKYFFFLGLSLLIIGGGFLRSSIPDLLGKLCKDEFSENNQEKHEIKFIILFIAGSA